MATAHHPSAIKWKRGENRSDKSHLRLLTKSDPWQEVNAGDRNNKINL